MWTDHSISHPWLLKMGAFLLPNGKICFRTWAPKARKLSLVLIENNMEKIRYPMLPKDFGIHEVEIPKPSASSLDYFYSLDDTNYPDPVSRWQPQGIHGPSRIDLTEAFNWKDPSWKGISINDYIIYELHIGTFTSEGTFDAAIEKLSHIQRLGATAIELMPVIEFPGKRNWGYDGVSINAPHHAYGGPLGLKRLIDACHQMGLAVVIDVVYNHMGPEGNYLGHFGHYFTDHYKTPWGKAINFDGPFSNFVRQFVIDNALYWLTEFHADALRLDAIHTIFDFSASPILKDLNTAFQSQAKKLGRQAYIIAESDLNDTRIIIPSELGGYAIDSQWSDDFHHSVHSLLTSSKESYFQDFGKISHIAKAMKEGFVYDGQWSEYRKKTFGSSSASRPGHQFVICLQNHDQIGNAGKGKRLGEFVTSDQYKLAAILLFCTPSVPLLFMGQEWNALSPFFFFTSYTDEKLAQSVREGYQREFNLGDNDTFDPQNPERFLKSKLHWEDLQESNHKKIFLFYQDLISARKEFPCLSNCRKDLSRVYFNEENQWLILSRSDPGGSKALMIANLKDIESSIPVQFSLGHWKLRCSNSERNSQLPLELNVNDDADTQIVALAGWSAVLYVQNSEQG